MTPVELFAAGMQQWGRVEISLVQFFLRQSSKWDLLIASRVGLLNRTHLLEPIQSFPTAGFLANKARNWSVRPVESEMIVFLNSC